MTAFAPLFALGTDTTPYRQISSDHVGLDRFRGQEVLVVEPQGLHKLSEAAFTDINHLLRPGHVQ